MLSEDRRRYGIIPIRSVMENASISSLDKIIYGGRWHPKVEKELVSKYFEKMHVKTPSLETAIQGLSGGNQQKVVIGKGILTEPKILLMDEPFAALDLPAKQDAMQFMRYYLSLGNSIVIASHEEAVFQFCHTVYLLKNGTLFDASHLPEGTNYIDLLRN